MTDAHLDPEATRAKLTSRIRIQEGVLFQDLDGEAVLLNQTSGKYYGLDPTGTRMWALLAEHGDVDTVYRVLLKTYDVSEERLRGDLLRFVDRLADQGLLQVEDA